MNTTELGVIALSPTAWTGNEINLAIAKSAVRAGADGVIDLELLEHKHEAEAAIHGLSEGLVGSGRVGIRCGVEQVAEFNLAISELSKWAGEKLAIICVKEKSFEKKSLSQCVHTLHKLNFTVLCEAIDINEGKLAASAGANGIIAKGHEGAGRVGEETSFILLQRFKREIKLPIWVRGGVGLHSAAAVLAAGGSGVILDSQLLLTRESALTNEQKEKLCNFDGTETELLDLGGNERFRLWHRPGDESLKLSLDKLRAIDENSEKSASTKSSTILVEKRAALSQIMKNAIANAGSQLPAVFAIGQDIAFADSLARKYVCVNAIISAIQEQAKRSIELAAEQNTLAQFSPFAESHGIKYPIVQGAMTRVSDTSEFALKVAEGGGLPFLALALMRKNEIEPLLQECKEKLGTLPWGVGMLGFVPPELRQEQLQLVLQYRPPCALIAGGRPDQAKELESLGIKTYLHVPSPALLESFVEMGARRFIFEGKECGGHVGPRSSFVLWETMIETLLNVLPQKCNPEEFHIVFAGGIHDSMSSAMVAAMAAPLVEKGIRVAVLMGTAYLFTKEAVSAGAIVEKFQEAALSCDQTVLLETGPGHAIRCVDSPYKKTFDDKRKSLEQSGLGKNELRQELELMNLGRLRVASKGLARGEAGASTGSKLVKVSSEKQWADGMYMIGQVASMHDKTLTIAQLHDAVSDKANALLKSNARRELQTSAALAKENTKKEEEAIAIIGMGCVFPKANDAETFWENILGKVDTIEEVPKEQWDWEKLYSNDPLARDKVFSKWGGFLQDIPFDPSIYGIPPASLASIDPMQLLILEVTRAAIHDAGYQNKPFPRDKTSVVLANAGHGPITAFYSLRSMLDWTLSDMDPEYRKKLEQRLPEWTEDSFPGYLGNVVAGRVANRFDLGGINFCVDAACASSLAALYIGIRELRAGSSDIVMLASTDTHNQPGDYLSFSKTHALSPRGRCRTFDASADGIVISEGMAVLVLKRLKDAERDGDRIYAVVRGIGGSSDGRDLSLTAPRPAGQMSALKRAYEDAGISPASVELVEAHGTGTVAGDRAEVEALKRVFENAGAEKQVCAIGSVKTMIGHTKCSAGLASMIKVARSLYHKVLPPTMGVETPSPACNFSDSPFYLNMEARPWIHDSEKLGYPRRAGVSAFGFGGTNFHAVMEEYTGQQLERQDSASRTFPTELFCFRSNTRAQLEKNLEALTNSCNRVIELQKQARSPVASGEPKTLLDLAYRHHLAQANAPTNASDQRPISLAIIASSLEDVLKKIEQAKDFLKSAEKCSLKDPRGIFFEDRSNTASASEKPRLAFLFPGQGSQQINMLRDLVLNFSFMRKNFEKADKLLEGKFKKKLSRYVYPHFAFSEEERKLQAQELTNTHVAQPAVAAADMAAFKLLSSLGLKADFFAGHSFGEYVSLCAANAIDENDLYKIAEQRGAILKEANGKNSGSMTAVSLSGQKLHELLSGVKGITLANINSPRQCIISGDADSLAQANLILEQNKIKFKPIAVSAAFHSPLMKPAVKPLSEALAKVRFSKPQTTVYSNTLAAEYPNNPSEISALLCEHLVKPVEFQRQIEHMHKAGARVFIECGPGSVLSGLVDDILEGKEHYAISLERSGKHGITQIQHLLAQVFVLGIDSDLSKLYRHRIDALVMKNEKKSASTKPKLMYLINGSQIKRYDGKIALPANRPTEHAYASIDGNVSSLPASVIKPGPGQGLPSSAKMSSSNPTPGNPSTSTPVGTHPSASSTTNNPSSPAMGTAASTAMRGTSSQPTRPNETQSTRPQQILPASASSRSAREQVMLEFQRNMVELTGNFLQAQERVMMAYLQGNAGIEPQTTAAPYSIPLNQATVTPRTSTTTARVQQDIAPAMPARTMTGNEAVVNNASSKAIIDNLASAVATNNNNNGSSPNNGNLPNNGGTPNNGSSLNDGGPNNGAPNNGSSDKNGNSGSRHAIDPEHLIAQLIQIVSERTGYPSEMLDPTLDLEADLGIDSIKRVEILNSFRKILPDEVQAQLEQGIEKLAGTKTLQGIIDWIRTDLSSALGTSQNNNNGNGSSQDAAKHIAAPAKKKTESKNAGGNGSGSHSLTPVAEAPGKNGDNAKHSGIVARALVKAKQLQPLPLSTQKLSGIFLITDSADGLAETLAEQLHINGAKGLILKHQSLKAGSQGLPLPKSLDMTGSKPKTLQVDLCDEETLSQLKTLLADAEIAGLVHLLPMHKDYKSEHGSGEEIDAFEQIDAYAPVRSLYNIARSILSPLALEGQKIKLLAATTLGGSFTIDSTEEFNPLNASVPGFIKTFAREYQNSTSRCVDFASAIKIEDRADLILAELKNDDKALWEVAYDGKRRSTPEPVPTAVNKRNPSKLDLDSSSVILVTGGARGITADLCVELGQRHKPVFVIVGRGIRPSEAEDPAYKSLNTPKELKAAIMDKLRREAKPLSIPAIESVYQRLIKEREIRNNLQRIEATGARVQYCSLDVRDRNAFCELIDRLYESFGKIDAVLNGAGVIEDAFIKDKPLSSFDRVFGTKVDAALTLASRLQFDSLKYFILFSSVVGRTGNAGQADYVAANEVMNKLAIKLNKQAPGRVISIGWGPWRGGMASDDLEEVFARYGWSMIEAGDGRKAFYEELCFGADKDAEVLLVGQLNKNGSNGNGNGSDAAEHVVPRGARLSRAEVLKQTDTEMQLRLRLDPEFDIYLKDHAFDGTPVLPMAVATELMSEAAQFMHADLKLNAMQNMDIPSGIMFENGARDLFINLKEISRTSDTVTLEIFITLTAAANRRTFTAKAVLKKEAASIEAQELSFSQKYQKPEFSTPEAPPTVHEVYSSWMFHGPLFQGISSVDQMGHNGIEGQLEATPIADCLKEIGTERWLVDPLLLDSAMQLAGVWARNYMGITALPTGFTTLHLFSKPEGTKFRAIVQIPHETKNGQLKCNVGIYNESGELVMVMEELGGVGSKALNRLGAQPKALRGKQK